MNDGGPAFPRSTDTDANTQDWKLHTGHDGMSLRDWFAGQAMAAIVGKMPLMGVNQPKNGPEAIAVDAGARTEILAAIAHGAYSQADAMLAERNRT